MHLVCYQKPDAPSVEVVLESRYRLCQCDLGQNKLWEALYVQIHGDTQACAQAGSCMHMNPHSSSIWLSTGHLWRTNLVQARSNIIKHKLVHSSPAKLREQQANRLYRSQINTVDQWNTGNPFVASSQHIQQCSIIAMPETDKGDENTFTVILEAARSFCEHKPKRLNSTFIVAMCRDVEWSGHVVMHGRGPILTDLATRE